MSTDPATRDDVRELTAAMREATGVLRELVTKIDAMEGDVATVAMIAPPAAAHFDAINKAAADTLANAAEAGKRRRATLDEWAAWLTPTRAVQIILALAALCGLGGPMTGLAGRVQTAYTAATNALTSEAP